MKSGHLLSPPLFSSWGFERRLIIRIGVAGAELAGYPSSWIALKHRFAELYTGFSLHSPDAGHESESG